MTTEEKNLRGVRTQATDTTTKKPSPTAFIIWLIATIVFWGGAITLSIFTFIWGDYYQDYKRGYENAKMELEQPCDEFENFIDACKSGEYDDFYELELYWNRYIETLRSRSYYTYDTILYRARLEFSGVESLAMDTGFYDSYNSGKIIPEHADDFEKALRVKCNAALRISMNNCERSAENELSITTTFFISCIVCLIMGIVGIFVTIKQRKKLQEGRAAYESSVLENVAAEENQKREMLLTMEAMQRKIDELQKGTFTAADPKSATQAPLQQTDVSLAAIFGYPTDATVSSSEDTSDHVILNEETDTQAELEQDDVTESENENQESTLQHTEVPNHDQVTIGETPKNPIKYLKFLVKAPIKTLADIKQMKKSIRPLLYTSIGVLAVPMVLIAITELTILSSISFIGLVGLGFCGFLHFVLKKAQQKFEALMCNACHMMITTETTKKFREYVSYEIQNEKSTVTIQHPESRNGIVSDVNVFGAAGAEILITMKCPNCGKTKSIIYSIAPFKCEKRIKTVSVLELATVKLALEAEVQTVLDLYMDHEKRKEIPYTIQSVHHPNYENREKAKVCVTPTYRDVKITYHRDIEEMVEGFFVHNELNGTVTNIK